MPAQVEEFFRCEDFSQRGVELIAEAAAAAVAARGRFALALTGGNTVQPVYRHLAAGADRELRRRLAERTDYFWGDERLVEPAHPDSNFGMARRLFLDEFAVPPGHLHPMPTAPADPVVAARAYDQELRDYFGGGPAPAGVPVFDLILLGLGPDGHVASLFPGSPALAERQHWTVRVSPPELAPRVARLTLSLPVLNQGRLLVLLAAGGERCRLARRISAGEAGTEALPAARLRPAAGRLLWLLLNGS